MTIQDVQPLYSWVPIDSIRPNEYNPRIIRDEAFKALVRSIRKNPYFLTLRPVIYQEGVILGGEKRWYACKHLLWPAVPAIDAAILTPEQQAEFTIRDNTHQGEWDFDALANSDLWDSGDLTDWGVEGVDDTPSVPGSNQTKTLTFRLKPDVHETVVDLLKSVDDKRETALLKLLNL